MYNILINSEHQSLARLGQGFPTYFLSHLTTQMVAGLGQLTLMWVLFSLFLGGLVWGSRWAPRVCRCLRARGLLGCGRVGVGFFWVLVGAMVWFCGWFVALGSGWALWVVAFVVAVL